MFAAADGEMERNGGDEKRSGSMAPIYTGLSLSGQRISGEKTTEYVVAPPSAAITLDIVRGGMKTPSPSRSVKAWEPSEAISRTDPDEA